MVQITKNKKILLEAYSEKNLNEISTKIISCYKSKKYAYIFEVYHILEGGKASGKEKINKIFNRLIMRFHPDKFKLYQQEIKSIFDNNDENKIDDFNKIFFVLQLNDTTTFLYQNDDFSFEAEYVWDFDAEGFSYFTPGEEYINESQPSKATKGFEINTFLSAIKRREYGDMNIDFPVHQLYDIEEIEIADYEINDLSGLEHCRFLKILDLSNNEIFDISGLNFLKKTLEEIYLANNKIHYIDKIQNLKKLRILDISENNVSDISVLLHLPKLEYVNLSGNNILDYQVELLKQNDVMVVI